MAANKGNAAIRNSGLTVVKLCITRFNKMMHCVIVMNEGMKDGWICWWYPRHISRFNTIWSLHSQHAPAASATWRNCSCKDIIFWSNLLEQQIHNILAGFKNLVKYIAEARSVHYTTSRNNYSSSVSVQIITNIFNINIHSTQQSNGLVLSLLLER